MEIVELRITGAYLAKREKVACAVPVNGRIWSTAVVALKRSKSETLQTE